MGRHRNALCLRVCVVVTVRVPCAVMEDSRTVVVSGVPAALPSGRMADKLTIHFQSCRRSGGGDVEEVKYPTDLHGVAFVTFDKVEGK